MTESHWCDGCVADVAFDRFDCGDHGPDCVELVCTVCGNGLEVIAVGFATPRTPVADVAAAHEAAA